MIPPDLVDRHRATQRSLVTLANRDLLAVWRTLDLDDARAATDALLPTMRDLTGVYGELSAVAAADFYDDARAATRPGGRYAAIPAVPAAVAQVDALTRWAVTPLWSTDPRYGDALKRLAGESGRLIRAAGEDTVTGASDADPQARGWQRITAPGACKFCVGLSGRGGVYTRATVRFASHTNCMCSAAPSWDPNAPEVPVEAYVASARTSTMTDEQRARHRAGIREWLNRDFPDLPG